MLRTYGVEVSRIDCRRKSSLCVSHFPSAPLPLWGLTFKSGSLQVPSESIATPACSGPPAANAHRGGSFLLHCSARLSSSHSFSEKISPFPSLGLRNTVYCQHGLCSSWASGMTLTSYVLMLGRRHDKCLCAVRP
eukprot:384313-Pelagomonas_calceolata.AAC.3